MKKLKPFEIDLSGINLVEASAGTGKTYNITSLYIRTLIERDVTVSNILVVTYTEAATKELRDRLLNRIRQSISVLKKGKSDKEDDQFLDDLLDHVSNPGQAIEKLDAAVRSFDEASVYTIHGFCYQALQEQAFDSRAMYDAEMIGDDSDLVLEAVDDYWRNWIADTANNPWKKPLVKLILDRGYEPEKLAKELGKHLGKPYLKIKPQNNVFENQAEALKAFRETHASMARIWKDERSHIYDILSGDEMSNYRASWLPGWFDKMDAIMGSEAAVIDIFDQFERFTQHRIDNGITKSAEKKGNAPPQHQFFQLADRYWELAHSFAHYEVAFKKDLFLYLRKELREKKEELQVLSYDDLLLRLREALFNPQRGAKLADKLREKYPIAMVDEFQDTDPNQYDIFRRIYRGHDPSSLFMIGDPKQSIYSFRGADVHSYIKAREDAPEKNKYKLNRNFRSTPNLIDGLNAFFTQHDNPFFLRQINYKQIGQGKPDEKYDLLLEDGQSFPSIRFRRLSELGQEQINKGEAKEKVAKDTVKEIQRLLEGGKNEAITIGGNPVRAKDIAVLVRRHDQADLISEALQEEGIKSVRHSDKSVFQSPEARQLQILLKAMAEPSNETLIKTALSLPLTDYSAVDLLEMEEEEDRWIGILDQFSEWHRKWQDHGFAAMFRSVMKQANISHHVITYSDGERRLTNLLHLGELLQQESQHQKKGMQGLIKWLSRKRKEDENTGREEEQMRLESDEELIKIVTMHRSKGLEYPIVFCPFLWFGPHISDDGDPLVYHDPTDTETTILDFTDDSNSERPKNRRLAMEEELAESLRLAYVAMTRAKQCLYLTWDYASSSEFSALGYLLQDPKDVENLLRDKFGDEKYQKPDGDSMHIAIEKLCRQHPHFFSMEYRDFTGESDSDYNDSRSQSLTVREFHRATPLKPSYRVSSFSSLTSWMDEDPDLPDYDQFLGDEESTAPVTEKESEQSIFTFPKGPQPGTCIHKIFEEADFNTLESIDTTIEQSLLKYGIGLEWKNVVLQMVQTVVD
ncbi:MAG TPA: exodeoxyribonuclease V subunit beta, partial [Balneolaceae bacterium]|nr:exodeoxyribonuclease V subunit beta [Balneolaceae bacterium]